MESSSISEILNQKERLKVCFDDLIILSKSLQSRIQFFNQFAKLSISEIAELRQMELLFGFFTKRILKMKLENREIIGFQISVAELLIIYEALQQSEQILSYDLALLFHQKYSDYEHLTIRK